MSSGSQTATCPRCGHKGLTLQVTACPVCGTPACRHCLAVMGVYRNPAAGDITYHACGWTCIDRWITNRLEQGQTVVPWGQVWTISGVQLAPQVGQRALMIQAEHLVLAERFEDAARSYESAGRWKEAGEARRRIRQQVVTQVHVNVNDLFEQLRKLGLSASYTCPVCRSPFLITAATQADALAKCQYCGSIIRQADLIDALTRVIGHP